MEFVGIPSEEFRFISGYRNYQVSNLGNVRDIRTGQFKTTRNNGRGYLEVCLTKDKRSKSQLLHRLVAEAFIPNPGGRRCVDHMDHDKTNNVIWNLRWATGTENQGNRVKQDSPTSSTFKGVSWNKAGGKWAANIKIDGKTKHIGCFTDELEAARAYDEAAKIQFQEYAKPKFHINADEYYIIHGEP